jgi:oligopeptide transport system ATP-binding protein
MRQRVMIAMGLSCNPQLLIADEPTTALDVTIQAQIVDLVRRLQSELGMAIIWITHDLGVVAGMADRVLVMYAGFIVEEGPVDVIYGNPRHPYTLGLLRSIPRLDLGRQKRLIPIEGLPPDLLDPPNSCPFAPRCPFVIDKCHEENPPLMSIDSVRKSACWVDLSDVEIYDTSADEQVEAVV